MLNIENRDLSDATVVGVLTVWEIAVDATSTTESISKTGSVYVSNDSRSVPVNVTCKDAYPSEFELQPGNGKIVRIKKKFAKMKFERIHKKDTKKKGYGQVEDLRDLDDAHAQGTFEWFIEKDEKSTTVGTIGGRRITVRNDHGSVPVKVRFSHSAGSFFLNPGESKTASGFNQPVSVTLSRVTNDKGLGSGKIITEDFDLVDEANDDDIMIVDDSIDALAGGGIIRVRVNFEVEGQGGFSINKIRRTNDGVTSALFPPNAFMNLKATAGKGWKFSHWTFNGNFSSQSATHTARALRGLRIRAIFVQN